MLRHRRQKHSQETNQAYPQTSEAYPPPPPQCIYVTSPPPPPPPPQSIYVTPPPPPPIEDGETMELVHPFTMMISGPTACGKTTLVKDVLLNQRIYPGVHRIMWLYKRWQPLYTEIQKTVVPQVEFIQGIPTDLEDDEFFDPRVNNVLILDDLYSQAGKDKRITDLFTEGSHHRSLSVISINQNLFGNKDPTQRRNCHYLVLFNNPVDRQTVLTLARQMYPGNIEKFQKAFAKATKQPYGYLLVDLKPFTPENDRLKCGIKWKSGNEWTNQIEEPAYISIQDEMLESDSGTCPRLTNQIQEPSQSAIKDGIVETGLHSSIGTQILHTVENSEDMADKGQACDDCGLLFDSAHDVQRQVKRGWCPENNEHPTKKQKNGVDAMEIDEEVEDNRGYQQLWHLAQNCGKDKFNKLYDQYIDHGDNEDDAIEMAGNRTRPYKEKNFFERYQTLLESYWFPLRANSTHGAIVEQIENLRGKGVSLKSAVKRTLKKNRTAFEDLFELKDSDEEDSDGDDDSEDETIMKI